MTSRTVFTATPQSVRQDWRQALGTGRVEGHLDQDVRHRLGRSARVPDVQWPMSAATRQRHDQVMADGLVGLDFVQQ